MNWHFLLQQTTMMDDEVNVESIWAFSMRHKENVLVSSLILTQSASTHRRI